MRTHCQKHTRRRCAIYLEEGGHLATGAQTLHSSKLNPNSSVLSALTAARERPALSSGVREAYGVSAAALPMMLRMISLWSNFACPHENRTKPKQNTTISYP